MKKASKILACLLALLLLCSTVAFAADLPSGAVLLSDSKKIDPNAVKLIAYRGLSACAPANSLAAITLAGRCGCDGVSLDIQPTLDGEWVCISGVSLRPSTGYNGTVSTMTVAQLNELTITNGNGIASYPNEKIPTLRQAIVVANLYNLKLVLTINGGSDESQQLIIKNINNLVNTLKFLGVAQTATVISAEENVLSAVKAAGGRAALNTLVPLLAVNTCIQNGYVGFSAPLTDPLTISNAATQNLEVYGTDTTTIFGANLLYDIGARTIVSSTIVRHTPDAENVIATVYTKASVTFRNIWNKIMVFFQDMIKTLALDTLFAQLGIQA